MTYIVMLEIATIGPYPFLVSIKGTLASTKQSRFKSDTAEWPIENVIARATFKKSKSSNKMESYAMGWTT